MEGDILTYLTRELNERRMSLTESLANDGAKDFAEYRFTVGVLRGLLTAQSIVEDLANRMEMLDD